MQAAVSLRQFFVVAISTALVAGCGGHSSSKKGGTTTAPTTSGQVMPEARADHRAISLPSGEIFVVGGVDDAGNPLRSTAIVTVAGTTATVAKGPDLISPRAGHSATLLPSGQILIMGGHSDAAGTQVLDTSEIYDPLTGTVASGPVLSAVRSKHAAAVVDTPAGEAVVIAGGLDAAGAPLATAEVLTLSSMSIAPTGTMTNAAAELQAARVSGNRVVFAGGVDAAGAAVPAEVFDPATGTFSPAPMISGPRLGPAIAAVGNEVFVAGGETVAAIESSSEVFTNVFGPGPGLVARRDAAVTSLGNLVAVVGGRDAAGAVDAVELLTGPLSAATPTAGPALATARWGHTVSFRPDTLVVLGGRTGTNQVTDSIEILSITGSLPGGPVVPGPGGPGGPITGPGIPGVPPGGPIVTPPPGPIPPGAITTFPHTSDFGAATGLNGWTDDTNDDFDWTSNTGGTPSFGTGPTDDHTGGGSYLYMESSAPNYPNKVAILNGPTFAGFTTAELRFWYHMEGATMGTLNVDISTDQGATWNQAIWTMTGDQGNQWQEAVVNLTAYAGQAITLRFRGETDTGFESDIAIDDITVDDTIRGTTPPPPPPAAITTYPWSENFDAGNGMFVDDTNDDFDWTNQAGATNSIGTGPTTDHSGTGAYLYTEATGNSPNQVAIMNGPTFGGFTTLEMRFWYHMFGINMGTLNVDVSTDAGATWIQSVWTETGNKGDQWQEAAVDLSAYAGMNVMVRFRAETGGGFESDIAIDDINVDTTVLGPPAPPAPNPPITSYPYSEDFDNGNGAWTEELADDFDWANGTGATPSGNTGPSNDHTSGTGGYAFGESSFPNNPNKIAILNGPTFGNFTTLEMRFWFHMFGADMGTLNVDVSTDAGQTWTMAVWTKTGDQGDQWLEAAVDLSSYSGQNVMVRFRGETGAGFESDFAIDDVTVDTTVLGPPTPPAPPAPITPAGLPYVENFDAGMGQWRDVTGDDFNWTNGTGATPSLNTGPTTDHTSGTGGYAFVEASFPNSPNKVGILEGPSFSGFTALELRFWHHQYGVNQGTLELEVTTDGGTTWTPIWNKVGDKGDSWNEIIIDLSSYAGQTLGLRFKSTTGADFEGDVAIDDVRVTGN